MSGFILPLDELVWWMRVQAVYARSIGCSFAKPMNDTAPERPGTSNAGPR